MELTDLEKEFDREEDRFGELRQTVGSIHSEGIYPSIVGFKRPLIFILLKVIVPVTFAAILVWVDTPWINMVSVLFLFLTYFFL